MYRVCDWSVNTPLISPLPFENLCQRSPKGKRKACEHNGQWFIPGYAGHILERKKDKAGTFPSWISYTFSIILPHSERPCPLLFFSPIRPWNGDKRNTIFRPSFPSAMHDIAIDRLNLTPLIERSEYSDRVLRSENLKMPEFNSSAYANHPINIPPEFPRILKQYTKAAIRTQPKDLLLWSVSYFR